MSYGGKEATPDLLGGVTEDYTIANNHLIGEGRFISEGDVRRSAAVTVIGFNSGRVAVSAFAIRSMKTVTIAGRKYIVIGVMEKQGGSMFESIDTHVFLPLTTFDSHFPHVKRQKGVNIATVPKKPEWVDRIIEEGTADSAHRGARCRSTSPMISGS